MVLGNMELTLLILLLREMKSSESQWIAELYTSEWQIWGSGASDGALWTTSKFLCSLRKDGEQIKVMDMNIYFFTGE